jgi:hypothetical protein
MEGGGLQEKLNGGHDDWEFFFLQGANMSDRLLSLRCNTSIYNVHDDAKDKDFELELSWVCTESNGLHQAVPKDIAAEAEQHAKVKSTISIILTLARVIVPSPMSPEPSSNECFVFLYLGCFE